MSEETIDVPGIEATDVVTMTRDQYTLVTKVGEFMLNLGKVGDDGNVGDLEQKFEVLFWGIRLGQLAGDKALDLFGLLPQIMGSKSATKERGIKEVDDIVKEMLKPLSPASWERAQLHAKTKIEEAQMLAGLKQALRGMKDMSPEEAHRQLMYHLEAMKQKSEEEAKPFA